MEANIKLTLVAYDNHFKVNCEEKEVTDLGSFRRLIDKLLYLIVTRHDIAFSVQHLSKLLQSPKQSHYSAALRIVKYIKNQPGLGMFFPAENN